MYLARLFVLVMSLLYLPCPILACIVSLPDETPSLRRNSYPLTDEQHKRFEDAKDFYFKGLLKDAPTAQVIPFFEITNPVTKQRIFMLGTHHSLPFECLPKWFLNFFEKGVDEVYLESKFCTFLADFGKNPTGILRQIPSTLQKDISDFLTPCLNIFSKQVENLSLGELYSTILGFDAFLGMDATIELTSLKLKKPLFMLDKELDLVNSNIFFHKEDLKQELSMSISPKRRAYIEALLKSSNDEFMIVSLKEEFEDLLKEFSNKLKLHQSLNEDLHEWSQEPVTEKDIEDEENFEILKRNERWVKLLNSTSPSRKLVAVGAGHLLDLFERFKALGYEVRRYRP